MYVYIMYNKNNEVLYVGKTKDMRSRMTQHFGTSKEDWKFEVTNIKYMDCYTEVDMSIYEIFLINTLKPKYNSSLLYSGESSLDLKYKLKDYNMSKIDYSCDLSEYERDKIKQHLVIYTDKGKSKLNSNYDTCSNIKHNTNSLSKKWSDTNKEKYKRIIRNAEAYYRGINKKNKNINISNLYVSMWSNHIEDNKDIRVIKNRINNFDYNINTKVICYLRNDYVCDNYKKHITDNRASLMKLINIINESAIQNNETVYIYIPSLRMRNLLIKYLDNEL